MQHQDFRGNAEDPHESLNTSAHAISSSEVKEKTSIVPVVIRQVITAESTGKKYTLNTISSSEPKKLDHITLVAQISKYNHDTTNRLSLILDDSTGTINVILYNMNIERKFADGIHSGLFVRIYGKVATDDRTGSRYIIGTSIRLVEDANEITTHLLDTIVSNLYQQHGPLPSNTSENKNQNGATNQHTDGSAMQTDESYMSPDQLVYTVVRNNPGISFDEILSTTQINYDDIIPIFQRLFEGSHLTYTEGSESHYQIGNVPL